MTRPRILLILLALALAVGQVGAQSSGGLTVKVFDANGPLPGATVTISHPLNYVPTTADLTNADGVVEFPVLRVGKGYQIRVSFPGYSDQILPDQQVRPSDTVVLPVQLITEIKDKITVVAKNEVIDLDESSQSTRFSDEFVSDLPVPGRYYQNVLTLAPGVNDPDGDGNPTVHGSRARDFKAVVGGVSNVDPLTGQFMSRVNPNSIEEMEVITSGAGVEFGRAQGGFANIVQRQGSNDHEGVVEIYYRTSKIDGTGARDESALPDPQFDWFQPAVQFSGPIIKDKLWYRASHEYRQIEEPVNVVGGFVVTRTEEYTHDDQVTWQISPRNKLDFQLSADPSDRFNFGVSSTVPAESSLRLKNSGKTYKVTWTAPYSPKVLVKSIAAWQDQNVGVFPSTTGATNDCIVGETFLENARCQDNQTGEVSGSWNVLNDDHRQRLTVSTDATLYAGRFWGMSHQFQMGFTVENERYFRNLEIQPNINFFVFNNPGQDPNNPNDPDRGAFGQAFFTFAVPQDDEVRATGTTWGFYAEDQLKPLSNVTITLGMRIDREEIASEGRQPFDPEAEFARYVELVGQNNSEDSARRQAFTAYEDLFNFTTAVGDIACAGVDLPQNCRDRIQGGIPGASEISSLENVRRAENIDITNTNISPFLGVSWSPWSNGKTVFRMTAGRHYNTIPLLVPLTELDPAVTEIGYRVALGSRESEVDGGVDPAVNVSVVDRDLQTPYQDEFAFTVERELWTETRLRVSYINRKYRDQIQDRNINRQVNDFGKCFRQLNQNDPAIVDSPGVGDVLIDPYSHEQYVDTDPGNGDGRLDDCFGETELIPINLAPGEVPDPMGRNAARLVRPDGVTDLYVLNPFWGDVFLVGNFNQADYSAFEAELTRRQYRGWELSGSYVFSKATGDGEDFFQQIGDDPSLLDDESGYQANDQRHVVKLAATTITPWGIRLGTTASWQSGLPYSLLRSKLSYTAIPPDLGIGIAPARTRLQYTTGTRNDQRNDSYWNVDVRVTKELNLGRGLNMQLAAEIYNLFNDDTYTVYNPDFQIGRQVNQSNEAYRRFGRRWQFGMKLAF